MLFLLFVTILLLASRGLWAQDVYYVQSLKARIMSRPSFKAVVMGEASKGTRLVSAGKEGNWIKVLFYSKEGYIPSLLLSTRPPMEKKSLIQGDETVIKRNVRRRTSTYTSAAAARGLAQDNRRRLSGEEKIDYDALEKVESFTLGTDEVMKFMGGNTL